ncbi:MAG: tRNA (guanosine(46)-N7)-methyltransferase TrmB, partial [Erysipelotrichales bacterium]
KTRHHKRRLSYHTFLERYESILVNKGSIKQKTDNQALFEASLISYNQYGMNFDFVSVDLHNNELSKDNVMSEYERKFSELGQPIYSAHVSFKGDK